MWEIIFTDTFREWLRAQDNKLKNASLRPC